jgi:uncharacterized spore protein YtfJ
MDVSELFQSISQPLQTSATVKAVFGEAITAQGKTIIPVARVAFGFGGGSGQGRPEGEGRGGGGGVAAMPLGVYEVTAEETRFVPLNEGRNLLLAVAAGFVIGSFLARRR